MVVTATPSCSNTSCSASNPIGLVCVVKTLVVVSIIELMSNLVWFDTNDTVGP